MRTYGMVFAEDGSYTWQEVDTAVNGNNDYVWITTLIQTLQLNLGESPFYAQYGIPVYPTLISQIFPDYYVALVQQQFAPYFGSLIISKLNMRDSRGVPFPAYAVNIVTQSGTVYEAVIPV